MRQSWIRWNALPLPVFFILITLVERMQLWWYSQSQLLGVLVAGGCLGVPLGLCQSASLSPRLEFYSVWRWTAASVAGRLIVGFVVLSENSLLDSTFGEDPEGLYRGEPLPAWYFDIRDAMGLCEFFALGFGGAGYIQSLGVLEATFKRYQWAAATCAVPLASAFSWLAMKAAFASLFGTFGPAAPYWHAIFVRAFALPAIPVAYALVTGLVLLQRDEQGEFKTSLIQLRL